MRFSLQQMVQQTLAEASEREKLAASDEAETKKEKPGPSDQQGKKEHEKKESAEHEKKEEAAVKTSSVFVEKLASAVEYLNSEFLPKVAESGPQQHLLPNTLHSPTPGRQNYETGQAKHDQPPMHPGKDSKSPGQVNPATALETTMHTPPGGHESWKHKEIMKQSSVERVRNVLAKMAGEESASAHILAAHKDVPPPATKAEEGVPSLPGPAAKQEKMINSLKAAINYTKQQAKAEPKAQMGEVLSEPAQKKSTDPVLQNNLDATSGAGVKISSAQKFAAARALLQKIAEEGAAPGAPPEAKDKAAKLQAMMKAKGEKESPEKERREEEAAEHSAGHEKESSPLGGGY